MNDLIPTFNAHEVLVAPWRENFATFGWIVLMGFLVTAACGLIGNYLVLRRMSLVGDAISHSVLPGIVIAFLIARSRSNFAMFLGALIAGILTTLLIESIHRCSRVKQDSAIGIVFSTLFAIGVILVSLFASQVDLDQDCVLYGEIGLISLEPHVILAGWDIAPEPVLLMGIVTVLVAALILVFYKELLVSSFDAGLSASLGINPTVMHYSLMCALSVVVVSAFQSVGAILVIAMLILPGATAYLLSPRLPRMLLLTVLHSALSAVIGMHLSLWLNCQMAPAMVAGAAGLFILAWFFSPNRGLLVQFLHRRANLQEEPADPHPATASRG